MSHDERRALRRGPVPRRDTRSYADAHPGGVSAGQRPAGGPAGDPTPATVVYGHVYGPVRGALGGWARACAPAAGRGPAAALRGPPPRRPPGAPPVRASAAAPIYVVAWYYSCDA
jgi:hypothetical protein